MPRSSYLQVAVALLDRLDSGQVVQRRKGDQLLGLCAQLCQLRRAVLRQRRALQALQDGLRQVTRTW